MKTIWSWMIAIGILLIIGLLFLLGIGLWRFGGIPMHMIEGGRNVFWFYHRMPRGVPLMGLFGGLLMLIFPLGLLVLSVVGVVLLVQAVQKANRDQPEHAERSCAQCGKKAAPSWQVCPNCGESLRDQ